MYSTRCSWARPRAAFPPNRSRRRARQRRPQQDYGISTARVRATATACRTYGSRSVRRITTTTASNSTAWPTTTFLNLTSGRVKISGKGQQAFLRLLQRRGRDLEFNLFAVMPDGNTLSLGSYDIGKEHLDACRGECARLSAALDYVMIRFQLKATGSPAVARRCISTM